MRISFKEIDDGQANEIFVNDQFIGSVNLNVWSGMWHMQPNFNLGYYKKDSLLKEKFESAYKAGKEMASLYSKTMFKYDYEEHGYLDLDDADDYDMRDMYKTFRLP